MEEDQLFSIARVGLVLPKARRNHGVTASVFRYERVIHLRRCFRLWMKSKAEAHIFAEPHDVVCTPCVIKEIAMNTTREIRLQS